MSCIITYEPASFRFLALMAFGFAIGRIQLVELYRKLRRTYMDMLERQPGLLFLDGGDFKRPSWSLNSRSCLNERNRYPVF